MHRFKVIGAVLNLEHSNSDILAHAAELVNSNRAVIYFICPLPYDIDDQQKQQIKESLQNQVDFDFELSFLLGKPVVEITHFCAEKKLDMILIEPKKNKSLLNRFFHGSLTLSLMRKAPCPVWVVKKPITKTYQRVLIAVDPEEDQPVEAALNDKLIEIGTSYAQRQSAECYLVTAWSLEGESMLQGPFINTSAEEIQRLKDERKAECARDFERLQRRHQQILKGGYTEMLYGDPGIAIAKFIDKNQIDLIVMGTLGRAGVKGFLIGNTAETIINQVNCSIMAIKPDDFVSPILS